MTGRNLKSHRGESLQAFKDFEVEALQQKYFKLLKKILKTTKKQASKNESKTATYLTSAF